MADVGAGAGLSDAAHPCDRHLERGRHQRHLHARARRRAAQGARPAVHRREPARRLVQYRRARLRRGAARRLHALHHPGRAAGVNQFLYKTLGFDPENGFEPVTQLFFIAQALVVSGTLNVKTLPELVALSKAKPGTLSDSTASVPLGVFIERLKKDSGADLVRVPFRGGGEAVTALLNGSTPVGFYGISNVRAQLESGAVVGLLVDSEQRSPLFPNIPMLAESGQKKLPRSYFGLLAPAKTPKPIIARLQAEVARIAAEPGFRNRNFVERGLEPVASTPDEFARYIKEDRVVAEQVVKEAGLQPQ